MHFHCRWRRRTPSHYHITTIYPSIGPWICLYTTQHLRTHFNYMFCIIILFFLSFFLSLRWRYYSFVLQLMISTESICDGLSKSRQRSIKLAPHCSMKCTTFRFQSRRRECTQWPIAIANNCASSWWILRGASCEETWAGLFAVYVGRRLLLLPILLSVHDDILWVYSQKGCFGIRVLEQSKRDNKSRISYFEGHFSTTASLLCHCASITVSNSVLILKTKG